MSVIEFNDISHTDFNLSELIAIDKMVENNQTFHVYDDKRTTSVFVHMKDCSIKYVSEDGSVLKCEKGSIAYIPNTAKYSVTYLAESSESAYAQLTAFKLTDHNNNCFTASDRIVKVCCAEENIYAELFDKAVAMCKENSFPYCAFKSLLYSVINSISEKYTGTATKKDDYILAPCIRYMNSAGFLSASISSLAEMCHVSESCFRRKFKEHFGISPCDYILNKRIANAKELLRNGRYTVNEISELTGFTDPSYFSKAFKSICGISPSVYRSSFIL